MREHLNISKAVSVKEKDIIFNIPALSLIDNIKYASKIEKEEERQCANQYAR